MAVWSAVGLNDATEAQRIDAEYFDPAVLNIVDRIERKGGVRLDTICSVLTGRTPSDYTEDGSSIVVRSGDLITPLLYPSCGRPFLRTPTSRNLFSLEAGDVLISSIGMGSIGKISLVVDATALVTVSEVTVLRKLDGSLYPPEFLFAYLRTIAGQLQINREVTGATGQQHLLKSKVGRIVVPPCPESLGHQLEELCSQALQEVKKASLYYAEAESLLLNALQITKLDLRDDLIYERMFEEVNSSDRCDSEYYQPKYYRLLEHIQNTNSAVRLGDHLKEPVRRGLQAVYDLEGETVVINSQHVGKQAIEVDSNRRTTINFVLDNRNKGKVQKYDVLLNSTGYVTIGRAQTLLDDLNAIADSHVAIIRPNATLDPVYLGVYLNTIPGYLQTERNWTGSSGQIELRPESIENFQIWVAPKEVQQTIRDRVEAAHSSRQKASQIFNEAQKAVESIL
jgi:type I restriction enzyme M protein